MRVKVRSKYIAQSSCRLTVAVAIAIFIFSSCKQPAKDGQQDSPEIIVAAAANLTDVFAEVAKQFTAQTGIRVVYSFGSTADLAKQIENGAPFDLFASADAKHIDELSTKGLIVPDTRALYARGRLVLWSPPQSRVNIDRVEDIAGADVKTIAIAKPDLAPYGQASVEALRALNLWPQVESKVVYGTNVSQAKQYAASGNADVAFIPLALIKSGEGRYVEVDARLHQPIDQAMGVIKASNKQEAARRFVEFVLGAEGQALLQQYGYSKPPSE